MLLGVPTLNRYDLLGRLIASAEAGTLKPSAYLIVDNGRRFNEEAPRMPGVAAAITRGVEIRVLSPDTNLGVAASWNALLDQPERIVISNDDVELGADTLEILARALTEHAFVIADGGANANGWCLFAQTRACFERIGPYDENFYPAYFEDSDYLQRMHLAGMVPHYEPASFRHEGWATMKADASIWDGQQQSAKHFKRKWDGMPGDALSETPLIELKRNPLQAEWKIYTGPIYTKPVMRWDVINQIAEVVGAKTYLEIGVAHGENMGNVRIATKFGVDPSPTVSGVLAANVFFPCSSNEFFERRILRTGWEVAFIDGLHHAAQAYDDIMNAATIARVVVVHDANPTTEALQRVPYAGGDWTGDVWKAIARIRAEGKHLVRTIDTDFGVAVVIPDRGEAIKELPRETWEDLQAHRQELLGLISPSEWRAWFEGVVQ